jgi:hypothetical protein
MVTAHRGVSAAVLGSSSDRFSLVLPLFPSARDGRRRPRPASAMFADRENNAVGRDPSCALV